MSTLKANAIANIASTHTFTLDDVGYPLSTAWNGTLLTTTTTPTLASVGIIGLNPIAYVYPDGTIVGESDNGSFTKRANGELECRGVFTTNGIGSETITFPMVNISSPSFASSSIRTSGSELHSCNVDIINIDDVIIRGLLVTTSVSYAVMDVSWVTKGTWK